MSAAVQALIDSFAILSEAEQHEAVVGTPPPRRRSATVELPDGGADRCSRRAVQELHAREAADARP